MIGYLDNIKFLQVQVVRGSSGLGCTGVNPQIGPGKRRIASQYNYNTIHNLDSQFDESISHISFDQWNAHIYLYNQF